MIAVLAGTARGARWSKDPTTLRHLPHPGQEQNAARSICSTHETRHGKPCRVSVRVSAPNWHRSSLREWSVRLGRSRDPIRRAMQPGLWVIKLRFHRAPGPRRPHHPHRVGDQEDGEAAGERRLRQPLRTPGRERRPEQRTEHEPWQEPLLDVPEPRMLHRPERCAAEDQRQAGPLRGLLAHAEEQRERGHRDDAAAHAHEAGEQPDRRPDRERHRETQDRKSTRLNSSHGYISYAVFCLKKKIQTHTGRHTATPHPPAYTLAPPVPAR